MAPLEKDFPGTKKLVRAEGPGFYPFNFNLAMHVSSKKMRHFHDPVENYASFVGAG